MDASEKKRRTNPRRGTRTATAEDVKIEKNNRRPTTGTLTKFKTDAQKFANKATQNQFSRIGINTSSKEQEDENAILRIEQCSKKGM